MQLPARNSQLATVCAGAIVTSEGGPYQTENCGQRIARNQGGDASPLGPVRFQAMSGPLTLDSAALDRSIRVYRDLLASHTEVINRLNVYPVPDGDTGINMALTLVSVVEEMDDTSHDMASLCKAIGHGSLMGARGNSGVILSQIMRGLSSSFAEAGESVDASEFASALEHAAELAYGAVGRPVEGTILTVVRGAAEGAAAVSGDLAEIVVAAHAGAADALERTPDLLPVLKEAGVVDAGGFGLVLLFDALLNVLTGRKLPVPDITIVPEATPQVPSHDHGDTDLRYEVMYLLDAPDETIPAFKDVWAGLGDSIVVVGGDGLFNCHIHTDDIGPTIEAAIQIGRPHKIRITDLTEQVEELRWVIEGSHAESGEAPEESVTTAVVAVSPADGSNRIFHSLRVQRLVSGGQSMNPSTEELVAAALSAPGDEILILPNNKNIIAVAERVNELVDKPVYVVPTKSVAEGFAALFAYDPEQDARSNAEAMIETAAAVVTGEVCQAVRETSSPAGAISEGDWMGLDASGIRSVHTDMVAAANELLALIVPAGAELVTIITGEGATDASTRSLVAWLDAHRSAEYEIHYGGQPFYPYQFGIE
jgi:fatty acid kinase